MSYNKETDYQEKINEAVKKGDYVSAAQLEKSRNEKIDGEGLGYEKTNRYQGWLDKTDYSDVIRDQISKGAKRDDVAKTLEKRITKASGTDGLTKYAYDDVYDMAIAYIMGSGNYSYSGKEPTYNSRYDKDIERLYKKLENISEFRYNPYEDDLYEYYREQYLREGKRAMEDLLGELSQNTGGIASSYAATAAAQSLDYYNSRLTDKIPELYEAAYKRYLDEIEKGEDDFSRLVDLSDREFERYLKEMDLYNEARDFDYEKFRDAIEDDKEKEEVERETAESDRDYAYLMEKLELDKAAQALKEWIARNK